VLPASLIVLGGGVIVRGPVPEVIESFALKPTDTGTRLAYTGGRSTDLGGSASAGATW